MRCLFTGDWHGDWLTGGVDRFGEIKRATARTVTEAIDREVDLYVFLGDLADPDNPRSHRAVALAIETMRVLAQNDIQQLWIAGNHDVIEDGTGATTLTPLVEMSHACSGAKVFESPMQCMFRSGGEFPVMCFPYVARSRSYSPAQWVQEWTRTAPRLIVGHLTKPSPVPTSPSPIEGSETLEMPRGRDIPWPIEEIRARWPEVVVVGGHYHEAQFTRTIHFPGNLARLTHGEEQNRPGFLVMDIP
jgi:hypothetical protein